MRKIMQRHIPAAATALAMAVALVLLSGCAGVPAAIFAGLGAAPTIYSVAAKVSGAADPLIVGACVKYEAGRAAANAIVGTGMVPGAVSVKVTSIESFGDAACANPPSGDPLSTAVWLGTLVGQISTLTTAAAS